MEGSISLHDIYIELTNAHFIQFVTNSTLPVFI
jgi:hypothetical protein